MTNYKEYFLLDPDVIFLNHGSFGATPKPVFEVYQTWQARMERQPVLFLGRQYDELMQEARNALGEFLHVSGDDIVFIPNATFGVNIVARSIELNAGDEILASNHEYGACDYTWNFICEKTGAKYIRQSISIPVHSEEELIAEFWSGVTARTKVIFLSHITSSTALRFPVEKICKMARENGIVTLIDGAHSLGQIPLDLADLGADFYTGNCHKWAMAPKGSAFLYARQEVQGLLDPLIVSWGYGNPPESGTGSRFIDILQWTGTKDPAAVLSVPAALKFMHDFHWKEVQHECHEVLQYALDEICKLVNLPAIYPVGGDFFSQMGVAPLPSDVDIILLKRLLYDRFKVEVPLTSLGNNKLIRISVQCYNSVADIDVLLGALRQLI